MITRCPSCHTNFRVHAEQIAARAGHVRCGKCSRVFDALEHLIEEIAPAPKYATGRADTAAAKSVRTEAEKVGAEVRAPAIAASPGSDLEVESASAGTAMFDATNSEPALAQSAGIEPWTVADPGAFDFGPIAAADPAKHARRWPWLLGSLLLLCALLAQAVYYYRSAVIVLFPQVKPYAVALCTTLHCELPLPRRIELLSIEASDLQADTTNPNIMVLSATLKNRATYDQQLPLLELTLTDPQDQPVVRRVLSAPDYLGKAVNARSGFAANSEIAIKVYIEGSQVKATGYRLYLFYS